MNLEPKMQGNLLVITVGEPRIDAAIAIKFKEKVRELTGDSPERVLLDMGQVEFLDSSGLGALVAAMKQLGAGRALELAQLSPAVQKVFRLTRMDSVFRVHASVDDAVAEHCEDM